MMMAVNYLHETVVKPAHAVRVGVFLKATAQKITPKWLCEMCCGENFHKYLESDSHKVHCALVDMEN